MSEQLALLDQPAPVDQGHAILACWHVIRPFNPARANRREDDWYAALRCPECRTRREVVSVAYPTHPHPQPKV